MNDELELFVGQHGVYRDDVESRVAADPDKFTQFMWANFARFADLLRHPLSRQPVSKREAFIAFAVQTAWAEFDVEPIAAATRDARPTEWFQKAITMANALTPFRNTRHKRVAIQRRRDD